MPAEPAEPAVTGEAVPDTIVGRDQERQTGTAFLDRVVRGPAALLFAGAPGIGKTTLWLAAAAEARRRGYRVLVAGAAPSESQLSYVVLADLLRGVDVSVLDALPPPQRTAVEGVLLRSEADGAATDHRTLGAALLAALEGQAERAPVVVAVDDAQWVDPSSAQALAFALRRLTSPVGALVTARAEPGADGPPWLALPPPGEVARLDVAPLDPRALHAVLRSRTGLSFPRPQLARIERVSGGNPFYALELARGAGSAAGVDGWFPDTLAHLVDERLRGLDADVRTLLLAVAALAEPTVELVQQATGVDPERSEQLLAAAEVAGVLDLAGHHVRFAHPLLTTGVYSAASAARLRALHRRLAGLVDDEEQRARHLALAAVRADPTTLAALDAAALRARSRGAPAAAAELLTLAIELGGDTAERRIRLARQHFDSGNPEPARAMLEALVGDLPAGGDRAAALRVLALVRLHDDSYLEAAAQLQQALGEVGGDLGLRAQILLDLPFVLVNLGRIPEAAELIDATVAAAERWGEPGPLSEALASAVIIGFLGGGGLAQPALDRALELEDPQRSTPVMYRASLINGLLLAWTGRLDEARLAMQAVRRACIERGRESDLMFSAFHLVVLECWRGDLAGARLIAEDTVERAQQLGTDVPRAIALSTRATVAAYTGDEDETRRCAVTALEIFQRGSCLAVTVWPLVTLGFLDVSLGNYQAALVTLGPMAAAVASMGYGEPAAAPFAADAIEAYVGAGRLAEARALADQLDSNGRRLDRAWALALGGRGRALLLAAEGDLDGAFAAVEGALREHERLPMPFERARTLLVLGQIQRRRRRRNAAAAALRESLSVFDEIGTELWAARARSELARVTDSRTTTAAGSAALSPAERRVAELAATGMTNRDVAATLFISPKTVEANLVRIYLKLAIRSRAELGSRMAEIAAPGSAG